MAARFDIRQSINRGVLDQITNAPNKQGTNILSSINEELRMPLRITPSSIPSRVVTVGNIVTTNPETGRKRTIPTISGVAPNFTSGTVTLPPTAGGTIGITPGTNVALVMGNSKFLKIGLNVSIAGNIVLSFGVEGSSEALATNPPTLAGTFATGFIVARTDGGGVVQNIAYADVYQYDSGIVGALSTPFSEYTKLVGFGSGTYATLAAAIADAIPGDNILVGGGNSSVTATQLITISNIKITFMPNTQITKTTTGAAITITGDDIHIVGLKYILQVAGAISSAIEINSQDVFIENLRVTVAAGATVTNVVDLGSSSNRCSVRGSVKIIAGSVNTTLNDDGTDNDATMRG